MENFQNDRIRRLEREGLKQSTKSSNLTKITFFFFGLSSLSNWNAIITSLDFFQAQYQNYNVYFDIPIPYLVSNFIAALLLPKYSKYLPLDFRILWSLLIASAFLIVLPFFSLVQSSRYVLSLFIIFLIGLFNQIQYSTCLAISGIIGGEFVAFYIIGQAFSGTIVCIFRIICLLSFPDDPSLSINNTINIKDCLFMFNFSILCNLISSILFYFFKKNEMYEQIQLNLKMHECPIRSAVVVEKNIFQLVFHINVLIFPVPLCLAVAFFQTFLIFPGILLKYKFSSELTMLGPILLFFSYNFGDLLGRFVSHYRQTFNQELLEVLVILRLGFFVIFIMIAQGQITFIWAVFLNVILFACLSGFTVGGLFQIGPELVNESLKETVGLVQSFIAILAIMCGSLLAKSLQSIN